MSAQYQEIQTIDEMAEAVLEWSSNMQARFTHYAQVPTGMPVNINGVDRTLEGDLLDGFVAAMELAAQEMTNNPPFVMNEDA
jgi:hypothetical protein